MTLDVNAYSSECQELLAAFDPEAYSASMGRGAEQTLPLFEKLCCEERQVVADWLFDLFNSDCRYHGKPYLDLIAQTKDARFIPILERLLQALADCGNSATLIDKYTGESAIHLLNDCNPWMISAVLTFPFLSPLFQKHFNGVTPVLVTQPTFSAEMTVCAQTLGELTTEQ